MTVESASYITDLNTALPGATDLKSEGDDHIRKVKTVLRNSLPNIGGAMTRTHTELNNAGSKGLDAASVTTGAFVAADAGKCVYATGGVTVPNATMAATDVVVIQDTTGVASTITATITTLRKTGTTLTGNRTLAPYGRAVIVFGSPTLGYISGDIT